MEESSNHSPWKRKVAIAYGVTGGRHPQMLGAAAAINEAFSQDFDIIAHFGSSGGAIVAGVMSAELHKIEGGLEAWLGKSTPYGKHGKIGGFPNIICNIWNLFRHGGLLKSHTIYEKVFKEMFSTMELKAPAYTIAWCPSHSREVLFDLRKCCPGKAVAASASLPFAISPMEISNKELISLGYADLLPGILDDPDGSSFFADGGISSALGVGIVDNAVEIQREESHTNISVPVIGVNIDPVSYGHTPGFGKHSWYKKIWEACWGTVRANVLDDIREAKSERYVQLSVLPTPEEFMYLSSKFDASLSENLALFNAGYSQAEAWLNTKIDGTNKPVAAMKAWYERKETEQSF